MRVHLACHRYVQVLRGSSHPRYVRAPCVPPQRASLTGQPPPLPHLFATCMSHKAASSAGLLTGQVTDSLITAVRALPCFVDPSP